MLTNAELNTVQSTLGVYSWDGLARAYPDLAGNIASLINDKIGAIPWLPPGWLGSVARLQRENPDDVIALYPGHSSLPDWLNTAEKRKVWNDAALEISSAIGKYAKEQQDAGAAQLAGLYASAEFWDKAYKLAVDIKNYTTDPIGSLFPNLGLGTKIAIGVVVGLVVLLAVYKTTRAIKA